MKTMNRIGKYNYYAETVTQFMATYGLIQEEEAQEWEVFIRGCA